MTRNAKIALAGVLALCAAGAVWWFSRSAGEGTLTLHGGDGGSLPVATAEELGLDTAALRGAKAAAEELGAAAMLVARRGHLVRELLPPQAETPLRSSLLSQLVSAAGSTVIRERGGVADGDFVATVSRELWQPLAAADGSYALDRQGNPRLADGLSVRPRDGLALAVALQADGAVGGTRLMSAAGAARVLQGLDDGVPPRGAEPFGARVVRMLRDREGTRIYFFPTQDLVLLLLGADEAKLGDETEIAHRVLRGIVDQGSSPISLDGHRGLVPPH